MSAGIIEVIVEVGQLVLDLLKGGDEKAALERIRDFRQQVQSNRDEVDAALKKKHGIDD